MAAPRGKQKALGFDAEKGDQEVSSRGKPKALGSVDWMVASMECPREKPTELCLA